MMHTEQGLYDMLKTSLEQIETQIKHIKNDMLRDYPPEQREKINVWYWTYEPSGKPVLQDLLIAKSNVQVAMANLKIASKPVRK